MSQTTAATVEGPVRDRGAPAPAPPEDRSPHAGPPGRSRRRWFVVLVLAVALAVRLGALAADRSYAPQNDALHFDMIATSLAGGQGYGDAVLLDTHGPSAYRAPLYPAVLATVYRAFGPHSWTAGRVANAVIGTVLVALIGLVAAQLWGERAAAAALVLAALHPALVLFGSGLQLEPLLATTILGAIALALAHRARPTGLVLPALAGLVAGLAGLTRETGLLLVPLLGILVWSSTPARGRRRLVPAAALVAAAAAVVLPWTVRNLVQLDAVVPVTTSGGYTLAGTYNATAMADSANPGAWIPPERDPHLRDVILALGPTDEVTLDTTLRREAIEYARAHPGDVAKAAGWNLVRLFDLGGTSRALFYGQFLPYPRLLTRLAVYGSWAMGALALAGIGLGVARRVPRPVLAFPLLAIAFLSLVSGEIRYRAPIEPFTVLLAGAAVATLVHHQRTGRWELEGAHAA